MEQTGPKEVGPDSLWVGLKACDDPMKIDAMQKQGQTYDRAALFIAMQLTSTSKLKPALIMESW